MSSMFQVNFDLYSKLLMVVGSCWLFQTLALLDIPALYYIGMVFAIIQGKRREGKGRRCLIGVHT